VEDIEKLIRNKIEVEALELEDDRGARKDRFNDGKRLYQDEERRHSRADRDEPAPRPERPRAPRPSPQPVDPFFNQPYEPSPDAPAQPAWEAQTRASSRVSANIKTKRKVAALFKSAE
jgi:hypothetical protein